MKNLDEKELFEISKNSILRDKIKKDTSQKDKQGKKN